LSQRTRIPHVQKDLVSDASRLLDLGGLAVDRVASDAFGGRVVHVVTADETAAACPSCGVLSMTLKGRVCTRPRDIPYGARVDGCREPLMITTAPCPRCLFTIDAVRCTVNYDFARPWKVSHLHSSCHHLPAQMGGSGLRC
jgi:hypothetical protein